MISVCPIQSSVTFTARLRRRLSAFTLMRRPRAWGSIVRSPQRTIFSPTLGVTHVRPFRSGTADGTMSRKDNVRSYFCARSVMNECERGTFARRSSFKSVSKEINRFPGTLLKRTFFEAAPEHVAPRLLGKFLVHRTAVRRRWPAASLKSRPISAPTTRRPTPRRTRIAGQRRVIESSSGRQATRMSTSSMAAITA